MNAEGSTLAVGHSSAATGARIVGNLAKLLGEAGGRGLLSVCTAGGMGVAAIMESAKGAHVRAALPESITTDVGVAPTVAPAPGRDVPQPAAPASVGPTTRGERSR